MGNKKAKRIIIFVIILLVFLAICMFVLTLLLQEKEREETVNIDIVTTVVPKTIQEIIEAHGSIYIREEIRKIYVEFSKDLYGDNGENNKGYFENIINDLIGLEELSQRTFSLIDEEKCINIQVKYDTKEKKHIIIYNNMENFYETINPGNYTKVDKVKIIEKVELSPAASELYNLVNGGMFFKAINNTVGEGIDLGNGFTSYKDDSILIKMSNFRVKTIIFTEKYETDIFHGIRVGEDLETLKNKYKGLSSTSDKYGYVMYRTKDVYVFFYEDQIVIYGYSYFYNEMFEDYLEEYIDTKDLKTFIERVIKKWNNYEICEYDFDTQSAHITYPSRGVEINITNNDPLGITLYKNYYFTSRTKALIKAEKISLNDTEDYIEITERKRRENFER